MKLALIGYGKMGRAIDQVATQKGHEIVLRISSANRKDFTQPNLRKADVAIEFSSPEIAFENVTTCLSWGINVVSGTTGWNEYLHNAQLIAKTHNVAFLHASNFSLGVNIFFEVNKLLSRLMNHHPEYSVKVEEIHHTQKKDAPSGTAISLAEQIMHQLDRKTKWTLNDLDIAEAIPIIAHRLENVPGTHEVVYSSTVDDILIRHTAHNREGFALGAVAAAEYVYGKKGIFTMRDVLFEKGE